MGKKYSQEISEKMDFALHFALLALQATETFLLSKGFYAGQLEKVIKIIEDLLDDVDSELESK